MTSLTRAIPDYQSGPFGVVRSIRIVYRNFYGCPCCVWGQETPVSPLPNMCWYVGFRGDERAPHAS